ncbi:hypothetical protein OEZ86_009200 [Tetradesmus obliquus]|nr:hypothetical protein OEZ86_009200 [Tetradesmus obliquus]
MMKYLLAEGGARPVVIRGAMQHWPALTKWQDLAYLSRVAGRRTVPVELGQHYLQEGWGTALMTLDDFIAQHMAPEPAAAAAAEAAATAAAAAAQPQRGYLAQHQLFEQVPALAADIATPDYCMLGEAGVSSVNAWFGPGGTVTPLHQDPEHNLLAQVVGRKYVRLYHPKHTQRLYPHASGMHTNTSQVDLDAVDELVFPEFAGTPFTDVVLQPGDMLYMPPKHWHYVRSLSVSFSVSFWWS